MPKKTSARPVRRATRAASGAKRVAARRASGSRRPKHGPNRKAAEQMLAELKRIGRLEAIDAAKVQALRSIADELDRKSSNSQMWREYRETIEGLMAGGGDDAGLDELLEKLRAPVRDSAST